MITQVPWLSTTTGATAVTSPPALEDISSLPKPIKPQIPHSSFQAPILFPHEYKGQPIGDNHHRIGHLGGTHKVIIIIIIKWWWWWWWWSSPAPLVASSPPPRRSSSRCCRCLSKEHPDKTQCKLIRTSNHYLCNYFRFSVKSWSYQTVRCVFLFQFTDQAEYSKDFAVCNRVMNSRILSYHLAKRRKVQWIFFTCAGASWSGIAACSPSLKRRLPSVWEKQPLTSSTRTQVAWSYPPLSLVTLHIQWPQSLLTPSLFKFSSETGQTCVQFFFNEYQRRGSTIFSTA